MLMSKPNFARALPCSVSSRPRLRFLPEVPAKEQSPNPAIWPKMLLACTYEGYCKGWHCDSPVWGRWVARVGMKERVTGGAEHSPQAWINQGARRG